MEKITSDRGLKRAEANRKLIEKQIANVENEQRQASEGFTHTLRFLRDQMQEILEGIAEYKQMPVDPEPNGGM